jgi:hypothetical protein
MSNEFYMNNVGETVMAKSKEIFKPIAIDQPQIKQENLTEPVRPKLPWAHELKPSPNGTLVAGMPVYDHMVKMGMNPNAFFNQKRKTDENNSEPQPSNTLKTNFKGGT